MALTYKKAAWCGFFQGCGLIFVPLLGCILILGISKKPRAIGAGGYEGTLYVIISCAAYFLGLLVISMLQRRALDRWLKAATWGMMMGLGACAGYALAGATDALMNGVATGIGSLDDVFFLVLVIVSVLLTQGFLGAVIWWVIGGLSSFKATSRRRNRQARNALGAD